MKLIMINFIGLIFLSLILPFSSAQIELNDFDVEVGNITFENDIIFKIIPLNINNTISEVKDINISILNEINYSEIDTNRRLDGTFEKVYNFQKQNISNITLQVNITQKEKFISKNFTYNITNEPPLEKFKTDFKEKLIKFITFSSENIINILIGIVFIFFIYVLLVVLSK